ncbi:hypothetical protein ABEB36_004830 [Hypothenemus hampei]|uniref:Uncharacterized protein n=1 Tax=Hypothenemus hampei TaxID=57062 RepID=A0ABD1EWK4_HYPHA
MSPCRAKEKTATTNERRKKECAKERERERPCRRQRFDTVTTVITVSRATLMSLLTIHERGGGSDGGALANKPRNNNNNKNSAAIMFFLSFVSPLHRTLNENARLKQKTKIGGGRRVCSSVVILIEIKRKD